MRSKAWPPLPPKEGGEDTFVLKPPAATDVESAQTGEIASSHPPERPRNPTSTSLDGHLNSNAVPAPPVAPFAPSAPVVMLRQNMPRAFRNWPERPTMPIPFSARKQI